MATLRDIANYSWEGMTAWQKAAVIGVVLAVLSLGIFLTVKWITVSVQVRRYEREANSAKREAENALKIAADIAKEKLEFELKLAAVEEKRNAKEQQAHEANIKTLDARDDYVRALRERRTDSPGTDQLCLELAALGYPCS